MLEKLLRDCCGGGVLPIDEKTASISIFLSSGRSDSGEDEDVTVVWETGERDIVELSWSPHDATDGETGVISIDEDTSSVDGVNATFDAGEDPDASVEDGESALGAGEDANISVEDSNAAFDSGEDVAASVDDADTAFDSGEDADVAGDAELVPSLSRYWAF